MMLFYGVTSSYHVIMDATLYLKDVTNLREDGSRSYVECRALYTPESLPSGSEEQYPTIDYAAQPT